MSQFCTIHPEVKVGDNFERSTLFGELKDYTFGNYNSAVEVYYAAKNNITKTNKTPVNAQGEITLDALVSNYDLRGLLDDKFTERMLNSFKLFETDYSVENYQDLINKCNQLNDSIYGKNYFVELSIQDNKITPILHYKNKKNSYSLESTAQARSSKLYNKVVDILNGWGISIDVLHDAEERSNVNGVVDTTSVEKAADGLYHIIRIAKGDKGLEALPEEFGHVVYEAMRDTPLMERTLKLVKDNNLAQEILGNNYERYQQRYGNDEELLAEEAVGKLIAVHFLQQNGIEDNKIYSTILGRNINNIKKFFSKFNESELSDAINEVNENTMLIADKANKGELNPDVSKFRIGKVVNQINDTKNTADRLQKTVRKILENEQKRLGIYKNSKTTTSKTIQLGREIVRLAQQKDYADGILLYVQNCNEELVKVLNQIKDLQDYGNDIQVRSRYLRNFRNILFSYMNIMKQLDEDVSRENMFDDSQIKNGTSAYIRENLGIIAQCLSMYNVYANNMVIDYWKPILGSNLVIDKGFFKKSPKTYTVEDLINMDVNDISWFDCWLDSMSQSGNYLLKGMDSVVKKQKTNARLQTVELFKQISSLTKKLEEAGIRNQEWMFEKDKQGHKTGLYIQAIDEAARHAKLVKDGIDIEDVDAVRQWEKLNPIKNFYTPEFKRLNKLQKDYYFKVMAMKKELDSLLPPQNINPRSIIMIRKDLLERVKASHSIKDATNSFLTSLKEQWVRNSTETEFGIKSTLTDFEGFEYRELPVFYVHKSKDTSNDDISADIVSTLTAYASMAYENSEMMKIIDILETTRSVVRPNKPISQKGGKDEVELSTDIRKRKEESNIMKRMNAFFDMQIYKETKADEGTLFESKIDKGKAADRLLEWSSSVTMAFNILANISNIATGRVQILEEAIGGQFYNFKDLKYADARVTKELLGFSKDLTSKTKSSWLWTVSEYFNVMQDYDHEIAHKDFDKNWYERMSLNGLSMLAQQAGEFNMQHKTFFALCHSDKEDLTDNKGNKIKVLDAFDVKPVDSEYPSHGSKVVFKKGLKDKKGRTIVTKEELISRAKDTGMSFTDSKLLKDNEVSEMDFVNYISRKSAEINNHLHGIYNEEDKALLYQKSWGRLVGQYRKWIKPSINRRFAATSYNYNLDDMQEGFYRTAARFISALIREWKTEGFNVVSRYKEMSSYEQANLKRALTEMVVYSMIIAALGMIPDDDDDSWFNNSYAGKMTKYQLYRLRNEIGVMIPGPSMVSEGLKILNSPMAGMNVIQKCTDVAQSIAPWQWKEIQSGRYKGWYKPFNTIADLVPYNRSIYRSLHPENGIAYFK